MTVPPPLGFSTFLIRMGILLRITYRPASYAQYPLEHDETYCAHLLHSKWMYNLTPVVRQLRRLFGADDRYEARCRYLTRIGGENSVYFLPDL